MQRRFFDLSDNLNVRLTSTYCRIFLLVSIAIFVSPRLHAQSTDPSSLLKIYSDIKAQEPNFPSPKEVSTITVGSLDLSYNKSGDIPRKYPSFDFAIQKYADGSTYKQFKQIIPTKDFPDYTSYTLNVQNEGGAISVANIAKLNLRILINNWDQYPPTATVIIRLGDQTKTIQKGTTEVVFEDITDGSQAFSITVNGYEPVKGSPETFQMKGLLPFFIKWQTVGAGVITVPVLPVSVLYAPVVDQQQLNVSAPPVASTVTTSISFTNADGTARALASAFQGQADIRKKIGSMVYTLSKDSIPATMKIGAALANISSSLKSFTDAGNVATVTPQSMLVLANPSIAVQSIPATKGGPGDGDLISYYYNARVFWYFENGVMSLVMLGADGFAQPPTSQLKAALAKLKNQPPDFGDQQLHLNANSINALLQLDPLALGGPGLNTSRFIDIAQADIQVNGDTLKRAFNYSISNFNVNSTAKVTASMNMDSPNFPVFLGLDIPSGQAMQVQVSEGASMPKGAGATQSQRFTFNAAEKEAYSCRLYYDVVFGTFVYKTVAMPAVEISGTYYNAKRDEVAGAAVTLKTVNNTYTTNTDSRGRFKFSVPPAEVVLYDLAAPGIIMKITYRGKSMKHLKLVGG